MGNSLFSELHHRFKSIHFGANQRASFPNSFLQSIGITSAKAAHHSKVCTVFATINWYKISIILLHILKDLTFLKGWIGSSPLCGTVLISLACPGACTRPPHQHSEATLSLLKLNTVSLILFLFKSRWFSLPILSCLISFPHHLPTCHSRWLLLPEPGSCYKQVFTSQEYYTLQYIRL